MKPKEIDPIVKMCQNIIFQTTGYRINPEGGYDTAASSSYGNIAIIIGITGDIRGQVHISMSRLAADRIASALIHREPQEGLDEIAQSALSELGNMIMGNAGMILYQNGIRIDITPPALFSGENLHFSFDRQRVVYIPLRMEGEEVIHLHFMYSEDTVTIFDFEQPHETGRLM